MPYTDSVPTNRVTHSLLGLVITMIVIMHGHHKDSLHIAKVTLVSLGKQRAIYTSAGAATLIKTRASRNGVVHVIDSLV